MSQADVVKIHTAKLRTYLDVVEDYVSINQTEKAMEVVERMVKEVEALRYSTWHTYHTSGRPMK